MSSFTKNPTRKLTKKIRQALEKGQEEKAAEFQKELDELLKCLATNKKNKEKKAQKEQTKQVMNSMSDEEFMNQCVQDNTQRLQEKDEKDKKDKAAKEKAMEQAKRRASILKKKQQKETQHKENNNQLHIDFEECKKKEGIFHKHVKQHIDTLKEDYKDYYDTVYQDTLNREKNNKKKAKKKLNNLLKQQSLFLEMKTHEYMEQQGVSYEEAFTYIHSQLRYSANKSADKSKPKRLLDFQAKL
jgi:hypothetical protein